MNAITKEQLIEDLKASTQNSSGMFEISEDTICALMSMLTNAAQQLPQQSVPDDVLKRIEHEANHVTDFHHIDEHSCKVNRRDLLTMVNACRAAMLKSFCNSEQLDEVGSWNNHRNTPTAQDCNHTEQNLDMVDHFGDATQKAMLHGSEPETDNTNQQFESLSRGDK